MFSHDVRIYTYINTYAHIYMYMVVCLCCYLDLWGRHVNSQCDQRQDQYDVWKGVIWNDRMKTSDPSGPSDPRGPSGPSGLSVMLGCTHRADLLPPPAAPSGWGRSRAPRKHSWSAPTCPDRTLSSSPAGGAAASSAPGRRHSRWARWCSWRGTPTHKSWS